MDLLPNCLGYVIDKLGLGQDGFYNPDTELEKYFTDAGNKPAEIAVAKFGRFNLHVVLFDPNNPDSIAHRPGLGKDIVENDTFYGAIGIYQDVYSSSHPEIPTSIIFMRRR